MSSLDKQCEDSEEPRPDKMWQNATLHQCLVTLHCFLLLSTVAQLVLSLRLVIEGPL